MKSFLLSALPLLLMFAVNAQGSEIWLQPTEYLGPRSQNPYLQAYFGTVYENKKTNSYVLLHYESELIGTRHDFTFDLDRAFYRTGEFYFGRAHVWDLTEFKARSDRWGMLSQFQPINLGIQLNPMLIAPLGVHYLHAFDRDSRFAVSISPFAVPNLGSEVTLNENSVSTNRFGRLPPGSAEVNGTTLPVRYRIEPGNIFSDVLLKPNISGLFLNRITPEYTLAVGGSYAPDPNPSSEVTSSFVQAGQENLTAVAVVHPTFPYRAQGYMSHAYTIPDTEINVEADYLVRGDGVQALEGIVRYGNTFYFGYAQSFPSNLYLDHLLRAGIHLDLPSNFSVQSDVKTQLSQAESIWVNGAVHFKPISTGMDLYLACDLFSGGDRTYFGEWRTNDRAYGGVIIDF